MPRISLYRPEKGQDYKFIDRQIREMFTVGGTDVYLHKYIGTGIGADFKDSTQIQDLLFLENRDRKYDTSIYRVRGHYQVQDLDFNLSQFGLFLDNDMVYMTVHINDFIERIGRKPMPGDVVELPHLKDNFALNEFDVGLPRYFIVEDVGRAAEGFSVTWYPHLYRLKLKKISDTQQFKDILDRPVDEDVSFAGDYDSTKTYQLGETVRFEGAFYTANQTTTGVDPGDSSTWKSCYTQTIKDIISTNGKSLQINDAILSEAESNTAKSGYETQQFYTLAVDPTNGRPALKTVDDTDDIDITSSASNAIDASTIHARPLRPGYTGYLLDDAIPDNGYTVFGHGIAFPDGAQEGDYFLRTDYMPNRLFRFDGGRWIKREDSIRHTLTNTDDRQTQRTSFVNNTNTATINGEEVEERQTLSQALKPKADF
jgi:hypothetical protein